MNRRLRLALRKPRKMTTHYYNRRAARLFSVAVNKQGNEAMFKKLKAELGPIHTNIMREDGSIDIPRIIARAQRLKDRIQQA